MDLNDLNFASVQYQNCELILLQCWPEDGEKESVFNIFSLQLGPGLIETRKMSH